MKKLGLLGILVPICFFLVACSSGKKEDKSSQKVEETTQVEEKLSDEESSVKEDATVLLNAVLTQSDSGFGRLYGDSYEDWTNDTVFPDQVAENVEKNGLTPESDYTIVFDYGEDPITPTKLLTTFLQTRRDMISEIKKYEIKDISLDGDEAEVTFTSRSINSTAVANVTTNLLLSFFGSIEDLQDLNEEAGRSVEVEKVKKVITFELFNLTYGGALLGYKGIPANYSYTPQTVKQHEKKVTFVKNKEDKWVVTPEAYRNLISDLMYEDESYDVYYIETDEIVKGDGDQGDEATTQTPSKDKEDDEEESIKGIDA